MGRVMIVIVAMAVVFAGCGDGGVSEEEYRQKTAELALAQEQLLQVRQELQATAAAPTELEQALAERNDEIMAIIDEIGLLPDPGRDPLEQLGALVLDLHAAELERQEIAEQQGSLEGEPGGGDPARIEAYFRVISLALGLAAPGEPPRPLEFSSLRVDAEQTLDMELLTAFDDLLLALDTSPEGFAPEFNAFLQNVADWGSSAAVGGRPPG